MIKFTALVHKETGTVIKYSNWWQLIRKEEVENKEELTYFGNGEKYWQYKLKEMLFSDDFEVIYDSEFTNDELVMITESLGFSLNEDLIDSSGYDLVRKLFNIREIRRSNND